MEDSNSKFRITRLDRYNYPMLKRRLIDLYIFTFTKGEYAQYIDNQTSESTVDYLIQNGFGNVVLDNDQPVAFALATSLLYDKEFPAGKIEDIKLENTVYIAEVIVHNDFRRIGLATALIENLLKRVVGDYTGAAIRVWKKNKPALKLYQKLGFKQIAEISQTKMSSPTEEFQMKKIYLYKKLTS
ncbi:MAG: N-acetyltransferase [Fermentimonas sp.]|nr:N-acetyltransferase [Fermentimonas sp.]